MTSLIRYEAARAALAECRRVDDVMEIRDGAERLKLYARQAKDRGLLADAAEIHLRAERQLGAMLASAKAAGQISRGQPKKNCSDEEQYSRLTLDEAGIDRKLSARSQRQASISERAFEAMVENMRARIASGGSKIVLSPSEEINGARSIMSSRQEPDDSLDYFPTPPWATRALIEHVIGTPQPRWSAWEPACGEGHMAEVLREYFAEVTQTDIHDYGYGAEFDFLDEQSTWDAKADWIITNPPFGDKTEQFVLRAIERARIGVAMFVRLQWLESVGRYESIFRDHPPTVIAFFAERVPICKGHWDPKGTTATAYIWLVWIKGQSPRAPYWIPPGQREALTYPLDAERFTAHPVIRRESLPPHDPSTGEILPTVDSLTPRVDVEPAPESLDKTKGAGSIPSG